MMVKFSEATRTSSLALGPSTKPKRNWVLWQIPETRLLRPLNQGVRPTQGGVHLVRKALKSKILYAGKRIAFLFENLVTLGHTSSST